MKRNRIGVVIILLIILIIAGISGTVFWRFRVKARGEMEFYQARQLYEDKRYGESYLALASLLRRYRQGTWLGEATYYLAKSLSLLGREAEAKEYWQRIKDKYGDKLYGDEINFYLGRGYEIEGNGKEARLYYERVISDFSQSPLVDNALLGMARLLEKEGRLKEAVTTYEKVAQNTPQATVVGEALLGIAGLYENKGDLAQALGLYYRVRKDFSEAEFSEKAEDGIGRINMGLILSPQPGGESFIYKVEAGDNLTVISQKFNTTIDFIMEVNRLTTPMLRPGQRLKILNSKFSMRVSKRENRLYLENNGKLVKVYKVATGRDDSTPEGKFTIVNKLKDPTWYTVGAIVPPGSSENILGSRWLGLSEKGYGLHGTSNPADIGGYVTNGCVRLLEEDIQEIYKLVPMGTVVEISRQ